MPDLKRMNQNAQWIVNSVDEEAVEVYIFLQYEFSRAAVTENRVFQFVFGSFYGMDNAFLTPAFKTRYFELMEWSRGVAEPDMWHFVNTLYEIPNAAGHNSLQFSFVTKLLHTVDTQRPIYDSHVADAYGFKPMPPERPLRERFDQLAAFYAQLRQDYLDITRANSLRTLVEAFAARFPRQFRSLSSIKVLDFLMWSAGQPKRSSSRRKRSGN